MHRTRPLRATTSSTSWASGSSIPRSSTTGTGSHARPGVAEGELERDPDGHLLVDAGLQHLVLLVDGGDGREPHDAGALPGGDLDRERVEPADRAVERDRPQHDDAGNGGGDDLRALGRRRVVGLEPEPRLARLEAAAGELDVGDPPGDEVRRDVDVVVDRAADQRAGVLARRRMAVAGVFTRRRAPRFRPARDARDPGRGRRSPTRSCPRARCP